MLDGDAQTRRLAPSARAGDTMQRLDALIRRPWFPAAAGILGVLALAVIVIALAGGGNGGSGAGAGATARPAPASAPLDQQLRGLDRTIDAAASR